MGWKVCERPVNTLQEMIDNAKINMTVYEDGDRAVYSDFPDAMRHADGSVRVPDAIMLWDEESRETVAKGPKQTYEYLDDMMVFEDMNGTPEMIRQTKDWLNGLKGGNI